MIAAARGHRGHGFEQRFGGAALGQKAQRALLQRAPRMHRIVVRRQCQHPRLRVRARMRRSASRPPMPGMARSMTTTSGVSSA